MCELLLVSYTIKRVKIHTYNTYISSIHDIPLGAFGYDTLSDKRYEL